MCTYRVLVLYICSSSTTVLYLEPGTNFYLCSSTGSTTYTWHQSLVYEFPLLLLPSLPLHPPLILSHQMVPLACSKLLQFLTSLPAGTAGVDCFLEKWEAGTAEPPHSHPGDDSTTVVEGELVLQFFTKTASGELKKDGKTVTLKQGMTGYIASNRIHDAKYTEKCRLIYVHNSAFGFNAAA